MILRTALSGVVRICVSRMTDRLNRMRRALRHIALACGGHAALEFALVLPPFLVLILGTLETGMMLFVATHLESAVHDAARQIRTGNVQEGADPLVEFTNIMCGALVVAVACDSRLVVDVRPFDSFSSVTFVPYVDENGEASGNMFSPGGAGDIVLVRVVYNWEMMTPFLGALMSDGGNGRRTIAAAAAFRNEPFGPTGP